jgi:hypothetical protein
LTATLRTVNLRHFFGLLSQSEGRHLSTQPQYHFFVDAKKYETDKANLTGAEIKAMVVGFDPTYQLLLEQPGNEPDTVVSDGETIPLDPAKHGIRKFYSVPPATFGA